MCSLSSHPMSPASHVHKSNFSANVKLRTPSFLPALSSSLARAVTALMYSTMDMSLFCQHTYTDRTSTCPREELNRVGCVSEIAVG